MTKKSKKSKEQTTKLSTIIGDFTRDLSTTFPEYSYLWEKWTLPLEEDELTYLHEYFSKIMPERFFDILYQNEDIFSPTSEINTFFLPNVEFKLLYNCENITATTKSAIWKYLQLILFTLTSSFKDKSTFGESANLFDGIDESELQSKITEAVSGIGEFFKDIKQQNEAETEGEEKKESEGERQQYNIPKPANIFENLKGLFDGKIGKLAKELAGEMAGEFKDIFGDDGAMEGGDPKDIFKKLMKDPSKMMNLIKKLTVKLKSKFQSGEVCQEDMFKEATEFMKQFKDMGGAGSDQFKDMFQNMTKGMGLGKNVKIDTNALSKMEKQMETRERMRRNVEKKRAELQKQEAQKNIKMVNGNAVFQLDGEKQEKSTKEDIDKIMADLELTNEIVGGPTVQKKKKKNKK
jgi:hypothetical protein